ncbi:MAG: T9SS type A sorting domain-containing protein [Lewinellaceae bacterium]|nr:T9SS type A sorting domain-containing protein [Lewinellaceae bacterium]
MTQALQDLESVSVSLPYEQAYKTLKSYEIKIAQGLDMATAGYANIVALSGKDEAIYGGAVRQARHYLAECDRYEQIAPDESIEALREEKSSYPNAASGLQIQPNPANDVFQVRRKTSENGQWYLYSVSGKLIRSGIWEADQNTLNVDTHDISPGAYYITAHFDSGVVESDKVIILH